jgi:hypothetical protein
MVAKVSDALPHPFTATPTFLRFGATKAGAAGALISVTPAQEVTLAYTGPASAWTAVSNQTWLQIANGSGNGSGRFTAAVVNPGNVIGGSTVLTASITVTPAQAGTYPMAIPVTLTIDQSGGMSTTGPFGAFDTPAGGASVQGSIAVTGWALDDVGVDRVEIWRDLAAGEPSSVAFNGPGHPGDGKVFIANALFIAGARPDVETLYPTSPVAYRAGWGYLLLTWGLFNQGNGPFTLYAFAFDKEGKVATLGTKAIASANATGTKPFGALDVPAYGETKSGLFFNFGWALTPKPNAVDGRTCTIANGNVFAAIDSGPLQTVDYGDNRQDIAAAFPGFSNGTSGGGHYLVDTATLTSGPHQIGWYVVDNCGRADGIGSRFFTVLNP